MAELCPIGSYIMDLFEKYVEKQNQEASDKLDYKQRKTFKPNKANQAYLAEFLGKPTSNISYKLIGKTYITKKDVLELTEKLQLSDSQFIELAKLFAQQKNIMILGPLPSVENEFVSNKIEAINKSFINAITANLLFEIIKKKYPSNLKDERSYSNSHFSSIISQLKEGITSYDIKEICKTLFKKE